MIRFKTLSFTALTKALQFILTFVISILLARALGSFEYGAYSFVLSVGLVLITPIQMAISNYLLRNLSHSIQKKDLNKIKIDLTLNLLIFIILSVVIVISSVLIEINPHNNHVHLYEGVMLAMFLALVTLLSTIYQADEKFVKSQIPELALKIIFSTFLLIAIVTNMNMSASYVIYFHMIIAIFVTIYFSMNFFHFVIGKLNLSRILLVTQIKNLSPLGIMSLLFVLNSQVDQIISGIMLGFEDLGEFKVNLHLGFIISLPLIIVNIIITPRIAKLWKNQDLQLLGKLITNSNYIIVGTSIPLFVILILTYHKVLPLLFGNGYSVHLGLISVIGLTHCINALLGPVVSILNMTENEAIVSKGIIISCCINVFLNVILIPYFGVLGAALATLMSVSTWNIFLAKSLLDKTGIKSSLLLMKF